MRLTNCKIISLKIVIVHALVFAVFDHLFIWWKQMIMRKIRNKVKKQTSFFVCLFRFCESRLSKIKFASKWKKKREMIEAKEKGYKSNQVGWVTCYLTLVWQLPAGSEPSCQSAHRVIEPIQMIIISWLLKWTFDIFQKGKWVRERERERERKMAKSVNPKPFAFVSIIW